VCFTVDIAVDNIKLRIVEETPAGSGKYVSYELEENNTILGLHHSVKQNEVWIWVSKKVDMKMWHVLEYKIDHSETTQELKKNNIIMEKTMLLVEDKWLTFVSENLEIINDIFEFDLLVWMKGGEKEKYKLVFGRATENAWTRSAESSNHQIRHFRRLGEGLL
jgi:hypothetical protein